MRKLMLTGLMVVVAAIVQIHAAWAGASPSVILAVVPPTSNTGVGQSFMVTLQVQAGSQMVDGASAYLNFDHTILQVVSISAGSSLPVPLQNQFDNTLGTLDYSAGTFSNFPSGTFTLATVTFSASALSGGTPLTFNSVDPRKTDATFGGSSVLSQAIGGTVIVTAATSTPSLTPTITVSPTPTRTPTNTPTNTRTSTPPPSTSTPSRTPTETPTQTPTRTATQTPTNTSTRTPTTTNTPVGPTNTPSNTPTITVTPTPTLTPTVTFTGTPTRTPTGTPTRTNTLPPSNTPTPTSTPTQTATPTITPTRTSTSTPTLAAPVITSGATAGSTQVRGTGVANGTNCIEIFDCGTDSTCGSGEVLLGTGSTDNTGQFVITVSPPLIAGHFIFARDTCNELNGPTVMVVAPREAPALSGIALAVLAGILALVGGLRISVMRRSA